MAEKPGSHGTLGANGARRVGGNSILRVEPGPAFSPAQSAGPAPQSNPPSLALADRLIDALMGAPEAIRDAQVAFDEADRAYKARLANLSIEAMSLPLFVGKDGAKRTASNDTERALSVDQAVANDALLIRLAQTREAALRELIFARNTLDAARIVTQLLTSSK